jgi:1-acyl-sn-glycerol-3-phosphate acyltransferase
MSDDQRVHAPLAPEIERRFRSPAVRIARPVIHAGIAGLGFLRGFGWTGHGLEHLDAVDGPVILAANHLSHADTAAILGTLPPARRRRTCVAAALDVFGPAAKGGAKAIKRECLQIIVAAGFHAFAFDRHGPPLRSMRTAVDLIRRDWSLLLYPEGTRSRTGALGPFKSGVAVLAKKSGRPVVPVHVSGGPSILPCGRTMPCRGHATVQFGQPLRPARGEGGAEFLERLRQRVIALGAAASAPVAPALPAIGPGNVGEPSA